MRGKKLELTLTKPMSEDFSRKQKHKKSQHFFFFFFLPLNFYHDDDDDPCFPFPSSLLPLSPNFALSVLPGGGVFLEMGGFF
jgi:hypothetical protein